MTVYNINLGIGWASSGVEYAQAYRSKVFNTIGVPAKFIFTDMFQQVNLSDLTRNLGFSDDQIIWLYGAFTDIKVAPTTFTLADLENEIPFEITKRETKGITTKLFCEKDDIFYSAYRCREGEDIIHRVEMVSRGSLIRKDFYSYTKMFTEYYTPLNNKAHLYQRRFFNENGTVAYDEIIDDKDSVFRFKDRILSSKEELIAYFMKKLNLTDKDLVLIDRATGTGQAILRTVKPAKVGVVVHAEHFSENGVTDHTILWNNYYEYQFDNADKIDVFITATDRQRHLMTEQFAKYTQYRPAIVTIPVGSLDKLRYPAAQRKPFSIITASRLATEKHVDWLCKAVIKAKAAVPELTFDIYGKGGEEAKISQIIKEAGAEDAIRLMGHQKLTEVYQNYELYFTASKSEGFGLTLMEAVGSGLGLIGFDVRYGNQTFIKNGENGFLIPRSETDDEQTLVAALTDQLIAYFKKTNLEQVHQTSYDLAQDYLSEQIETKWKTLVKEVTND
ncbi:accessory Sec system glycosyltransferase GtfA [Streptococcus dentiloxodontae]